MSEVRDEYLNAHKTSLFITIRITKVLVEHCGHIFEDGNDDLRKPYTNILFYKY
jgi:hypothetical protein